MKRTLSVIALALFAVASVAMAAEPAPKTTSFKAGPYAGVGAGIGNHSVDGGSDTTEVAINVNAGYRFLKYVRADLSITPYFFMEDDVTVYTVNVTGYGTLPLNGGKITPYVGAGLGYLGVSGDNWGASSDWGITFALGSDFVVYKNWSVGLDLRYQGIDDYKLLQVTVGPRYYF